MWNWVAAFGVLIEFVGFWTLAHELIATNRLAVIDTTALAGETDHFGAIILSDGVGDGNERRARIDGGTLGTLIKSFETQKQELHKRTSLIWRGVAFSAIGSILQIVGGFGQAMHQ